MVLGHLMIARPYASLYGKTDIINYYVDRESFTLQAALSVIACLLHALHSSCSRAGGLAVGAGAARWWPRLCSDRGRSRDLQLI